MIVDQLVRDLSLGRARSVAFVVPSDASVTRPLYDVALATARCGWQLGIEDVRYSFVTPEPEPAEDLESEGIVFIGSTYPDLRGGRVLLDPQGESIEADLVVSLGTAAVEPLRVVSAHGPVTDSRPAEPVRPAALAA
jgi:hypothetical protein